MAYNGFISYNHAADDRLAPALQRGLQRLAKPRNSRRALRIFRDETGLSTNPHLWSGIEKALDESEWFVLLASEEAAASQWVNKEIFHWLDTKAVEHILPVVTDGTWDWDPATGDFTAESSAVPVALRGVLSDEPRYLDLRWARTEADLGLRNSRCFRSAVADLAAPMHGVAKDELEGEKIRKYRRARRVARAGVCTVVVLLIAFYGSTGRLALDKPIVGMAAPSALTGQPMPTTPPTGYQQVYADDFTSSTLGSNWSTYGGINKGVYSGVAGTTWNPSHMTVGNGLLTLRTYRDPAHAQPYSPWVEGGVALFPNSPLTYGQYLVRSRVTSASGVTQVMLLWPDSGSWPPEIDFNESNGTNSSAATVVWNSSDPIGTQLQPGHPSGVDLTQWHTWGVTVTPSVITFTVDGTPWWSVSNPGVTTPTHLALQQMVWPCADPYEACPRSSTPPEVDMQIDWVVVYSPLS